MTLSRQIDVLPVQLDFADFVSLRGDTEVLAAFDTGFVLLHELAHGVWGLRDAPNNADPLGACETYINQIRRELRLPERQHYAARLRQQGVSVGGGISHYAELVFTHSNAKGNERKQTIFYLQWDAQRVGHTT
jgi:hypothetical protein